MIEITNGTVVCKVSAGAYNTMYKKHGFVPVVEAVPVPVQVSGVDEEEYRSNVVELSEKPISQWSKAEVKAFAEANGIDLSGTKNVNEAKDRIKAYMNEKSDKR